MKFYATAVGDQAKRAAKTDPHVVNRGFLRELRRRNFVRDSFSTGFTPPVHSFSTARLSERI
jgi:hypothetical protein